MRSLTQKIVVICLLTTLPALLFGFRNFMYHRNGWGDYHIQYELIYQCVRAGLAPLVIIITNRFWVDINNVRQLLLNQVLSFAAWTWLFFTFSFLLCYFATSQDDLRIWNMVMTIRQESMSQNIMTYLVIVSTFYAWIYFERYRTAEQQVEKTREESQGKASGKLEKISVKTGSKVLIIPVSEIQYFESDGAYTRIITAEVSQLINKSLQQLQRDLPKNFVRVHRARIVNTNLVQKISSISNGDHLITLEGGAELRSSRTFRNEVRLIKSPA